MSYGPDRPVHFGPAHRVVSATVINWANGLEGHPVGNDIAELIRMLTENVESDRAWFAAQRRP